jgi:TRAP-type C4-dicarboxylate transport system permease small subunit
VLTVLVALSFIQVLLRQIFGGGLLWADTLNRHLVLWVGFLGAAAASAHEKQFAFEAITERLPRSWHAAAAGVARGACVVVALLLARFSWLFMLDERQAGHALFSTDSLAVPAWPFAAILPLGFTLVAVHTALRALLDKRTEEGPLP